MYEKRESFDFKTGSVPCRLAVDFRLDEQGTIFEFRKECTRVNLEHPERQNNCEMQIGEITHLAAIFLYESVVELISKQPNIVPTKDTFEYENKNIFNISITVDTNRAVWGYSTNSTFCDVFILSPADDVIDTLANSLKTNKVVKTLYEVSPLMVWASIFHEFLHHMDHAAIARENKFRKKYAARTSISQSEHCRERNPHLWLFMLFSNARVEAGPTFGKEFERNNLTLFPKKRILAVKGLLLKFVQTLKESVYEQLWDVGKYIIGYHMAMTIALAEYGEKKQVLVINKHDQTEEKEQMQGILKRSRNNDNNLIITLPQEVYERTQKKIMQTKNFFELLVLYENACNLLDIPHDARISSISEYRDMIATTRQKTLNGEKVRKSWMSLFGEREFF